MEMHQVRYFLAVCKELNFTRAALACNVSQPSLTRAIKLLEYEFGGELLRRERSNTHLTDLGRVVLPYLQDVSEQAETAKRLAEELKAAKKIRLKLGIMCTIAPTNLIELISSVRVRHPDIELEIIDSPADSLQDMLVDGEIEVAIYCHPGTEPDPRINFLPLFREQMVVVLPHGHRLAANESIQVTDLAGERYVLRTQCEHNECIDGFFNDWGVDCPKAYRSDRDDWVLAMVASGLGFGMIGRNSVVHPGVVAKPLVNPELWRQINLSTVRGRPHSSAVGALVHEAMRARWAGEPALSVKARLSGSERERKQLATATS